MFHLAAWKIIIIGLTGFVSSLIDTLAGGGGLITLPVLLSLGLPPLTAFGTNRTQTCIGEATAIVRFMKHKMLNWRAALPVIVCSAIGAALGTKAVQYMHPEALVKIIPALLILVFLYVLLSPYIGKKSDKPKISLAVFCFPICFCIGFYNGAFGPGTGSFWVVAYMSLMAFAMQKAVVYSKPANLAGNIISASLFILAGQVNFTFVAFLALGQILGASIGAHLVVYKGSRFIRPVFLTVVAVMIVNLLVRSYL